MADDLGYGDVGCYGQKQIRTPNIDRIAAEGMRFTDGYSGCTVCAPCRSVLHTGQHMGHTTVRSNPGGVPILAEDFTLAEMLKSAGYATGGYGKWGIGDVGTTGAPSKHGFDEFFGYLNQVHAHFYYPRILFHNEKPYPLAGNEDGKRTTYSHDVIAQKAIDFIYRSKDRPFFCYMPFTIPHWELLVPEDSFSEYRGRFPEKPLQARPLRGAGQPARRIRRHDHTHGPRHRPRHEGAQGAQPRQQHDRHSSPATTAPRGAWRRTTSSTAPARSAGTRALSTRAASACPYIARWPGRIAPGSVNSHPAVFYDMMPTFAELSGARAPKNIDGVSIVPTLTGAGKQASHEFMYWELPRYDRKTATFRKETPAQAVRMGEWKAVRPKPDGPLELYNLKKDIGETTDVAAENSAIMARIEKYLATARVEPPPQKNPPEVWNQG